VKFFPSNGNGGLSAHLASPSSENGSSNEPCGLLPEAMFLRALCLERRRTERSRKRFVLMLLDPGQPLRNGNGHGLLNKVAGAILSLIRETDIPGWYSANPVLGVIFTELGGADTQMVLTVLRARVTAALQSALPAEDLTHLHISFHCFPDDGDVRATRGPTIAELYPDLAQRDESRKVSRMIKRATDVLGSAMALVILSPIFLAIAAAIKLSSPGPVLFRQQRIGEHGVPFTFLKFRSMHARSDSRIHREFITGFIAGNISSSASGQNHDGVYKITEDSRVTPVGRFLRKTSLDELPQFLNVFRGEMSLVGPRPPIDYELDAYDIWHRRRVLEVRPGITGLWQVNGRSSLRFDDMVRLDLKYAEAWSLWLDFKILLQTPRAVFSREGAY
jgi:exopolysaccharide biosynthesis polyprenyl glycosylphosphotransferase